MNDVDKLSLIYESVGQTWWVGTGYWYYQQSGGLRVHMNNANTINASTWLYALGKKVIECSQADDDTPREWYEGTLDKLILYRETYIVAGEDTYIIIAPPTRVTTRDSLHFFALRGITAWDENKPDAITRPLPKFDHILNAEDPDTFSDLL